MSLINQLLLGVLVILSLVLIALMVKVLRENPEMAEQENEEAPEPEKQQIEGTVIAEATNSTKMNEPKTS